MQFKKILLLTVLCISHLLQAQTNQVPDKIPSSEILEAYIEHQSRSGHKAFAFSNDGFYGYVSKADSAENAAQSALNYCVSGDLNRQCKVYSVDGVAAGNLISISELHKRLDKARNQQWPQPAASQVPDGIQNSAKAIKAYVDYKTQKGHKAWAWSENGFWGFAYNQEADAIAVRIALDNCRKYAGNKTECKVIEQNNQAVTGWVDIATISKWQGPEPDQLPLKILTHRQLNQYRQYLSLTGYRAFAVSGGWHVGAGSHPSNIESAKTQALSRCQKLTKSECSIVAMNDKIIGDSRLISRLAPISDGSTYPDKPEYVKQRIWSRYIEDKGHKALASNGYYSYVAKDFLDQKDAEVAALDLCNQMVAMRRTNDSDPQRYPACLVIAVNDSMIEANVNAISAR